MYDHITCIRGGINTISDKLILFTKYVDVLSVHPLPIQTIPEKQSRKDRRPAEDSRGSEDEADSDLGTDEESDQDNQSEAPAEDDDDDWRKFQEEAKKENMLETKSKETHLVHSPYYPAVSYVF